MQNISRLVSRQSDARSNGALGFIPISTLVVLCIKHVHMIVRLVKMFVS